MVTLAQSALLSTDELAKGVIQTFVQESVILDRLPLMPIQGNSFKYDTEATLPGVAFRGVNQAYVESTGTVNQTSESLYILGGDADVDKFIVQTRGNVNDQRAIQTRMKVKALNYAFQNCFINGDNAMNMLEFDGLKKRLVNKQVIDAGGAGEDGLQIVQTGHDFIDALELLFASVKGGAQVAYMNHLVKAKIRSAVRRLGGWQSYQDAETGKPIDTYNGVQLLDIGTDAAGVEILPQTEVQGDSLDCSSIYAVRFGESEADEAVTGLINGGVMVTDLGELQTMPVFRTRIEAYVGLANFGGKGAARLRGVRL